MPSGDDPNCPQPRCLPQRPTFTECRQAQFGGRKDLGHRRRERATLGELAVDPITVTGNERLHGRCRCATRYDDLDPAFGIDPNRQTSRSRTATHSPRRTAGVPCHDRAICRIRFVEQIATRCHDGIITADDAVAFAPMARYFKSDNTAPVAPEILAAIAAANTGYAAGYGDDEWSRRLDARYGALFEHEVRVFPVVSGTAANALALATLVPPYGAVLTHTEAHIVRDECGAPEFMSGGARLMLIDGPGAKLTPASIERTLAANPTAVHTVQPRAVSITQATELGTVYTPAEVRAIADCAHANGLALHMDGARFANAVAALNCEPSEITAAAGVDVLSFGASKNGAMAAEAVVFFDRARIADFELRRKRAAHLVSKMRYLSAQLLAYVEDDLWLRLARRANALAARIATAAGSTLVLPTQANEIFLKLDAARIAALRAQDFAFYDWGAVDSGEIRLVVSWSQSEEDVEALCRALASLR